MEIVNFVSFVFVSIPANMFAHFYCNVGGLFYISNKLSVCIQLNKKKNTKNTHTAQYHFVTYKSDYVEGEKKYRHTKNENRDKKFTLNTA